MPIYPSDPEWDFVWKAFYGQKPQNYSIKRIYAIHHGGRQGSFENKLFDIDTNAQSFPPDYSHLSEKPHRDNIIQRWRKITDPFHPFEIPGRDSGDSLVHPRILPVWHAPKKENEAFSICNTGPIIVGRHGIGNTSLSSPLGPQPVDEGFFGSGLYFTPSA